MSSYESGFDLPTVPGVVTGRIRSSISRARQEVNVGPGKSGREGLTNKILASLPAPEFKRLLPFFEPAALMKGEELIGLNEPNDFVYFPESAVLCHLYFLRNGGATAAAVIGNDGVVGLSFIFDLRPPVYRTRVIIAGHGLRVKAQVMRQEFARRESFQRLILTYMSKRLTQVSQRAVCNGRHKLPGRLSTWLLMVADRTRNRTLPLTHADIAEHVGAGRAVITGVCSTLRTSGMIAYKRSRVVIVDRKKLEAAACECYQVLKEESL